MEGAALSIAARPERAVLFVLSADRDDDGRPKLPIWAVEQLHAFVDAGAGWRSAATVVDDRTSPRGIVHNLRRIRREVRLYRPDVVHAQYGSVTGVITRLAAQGRPALVTFVGDDLLGTPLPGLAWRVRERVAQALSVLAVRPPVRPIAKSPNLRDALPAPARERTVVLGNGVDLDTFVLIDRDDARRRLGWPLDEPVVLFNASSGDNQAVKNPALAQAAVERLQAFVPGARLRMMSGVARADVVRMMNAADCLLVTSTHEGSPDLVKEAMACNLPVVSVDCGDVADRLVGVEPGGIGAYDADDLARLLAAVVAEPKRSNGREVLVDQGLSLEGVTRTLLGLYDEMLDAR